MSTHKSAASVEQSKANVERVNLFVRAFRATVGGFVSAREKWVDASKRRVDKLDSGSKEAMLIRAVMRVEEKVAHGVSAPAHAHHSDEQKTSFQRAYGIDELAQ